MRLSASQLMGLTSKRAELMGKPHLGARYIREDSRTNILDEGALCVLCGRPACDSHHVVPRRASLGFTVNTPLGKFTTMSPLFALCRGCHNGFHGEARYDIEWVWKSEQYQDEWWSGHTLAHVCHQHDKFLFQEGYYLLSDKKTGETRKLGA